MMSKRSLRYVCLGIVVLVVVFIGAQIAKKFCEKSTDLHFSKQHALLTNCESSKSSSQFRIFFHPTCEYCQYEAAQLSKYRDKFDQSCIYFISDQPQEVIDSFAQVYGLDAVSNVHFIHDEGDQLYLSHGVRL